MSSQTTSSTPTAQQSPTLLFNDLIPIINKLQDIFTIAGTSTTSGDASSNLVLELPQIVVVGSQSSGKSSVLESIVGKDFLPRGSGIVTRRPLVLQLFNTPVHPKNNGVDEWGEFLHKPGVRFGVFSDIRAEIERETDRMTGTNKGVSDVPINLKVYSPNVVNLTLVDLPGITRVPIGDQPPDIELQIRSMIMRYITPPNAIILAVTAGNSDITNSDALRLARDVDPEGVRTLGVITKIDIMDKGTDAMDVLCGRIVPLRLGYIGVVLRSQKDIQEQKDVKKALADEKAFFETHPIYKSIAAKSGVAFLAKTLNKLLLHHITSYVPTLRTRLTEMRQNTMKEIAQCGPAGDDNESTMQVRLLDIIAQVAEKFKHGLEMKDEADVGELASGARIHYIFHDVFGKTVGAMDPLLGVSDNDIKTCLHNAAGTRPALFIAEAAFELLARRQIALLRDPALQCIDMVVNDILDVELAFINIAHPDFGGSDEVTSRLLKNTMRTKHAEGGAGAVAVPTPTPSKSRKVPGQIRAGSYQTDKEKFEIDVIKTLLVSYFDIVRKRLRDLVPKSTMLFLVQKCQADMQNALVQDLYGDPTKVAKLMQVADELVVRRRELTALLALLDQAVTVLATIGQRPSSLAMSFS